MIREALSAARETPALPAGYAGIHSGIVELLDAARHAVARSVNALMTASYWEIGRRIVEAEQQGKRRAGCEPAWKIDPAGGVIGTEN